jgi:hypothetical protein
MIKPADQFLLCALNNGQFLGWVLSSNSLENQPGHPAEISTVCMHQNFVLSADTRGVVQIRDWAN